MPGISAWPSQETNLRAREVSISCPWPRGVQRCSAAQALSLPSSRALFWRRIGDPPGRACAPGRIPRASRVCLCHAGPGCLELPPELRNSQISRSSVVTRWRKVERASSSSRPRNRTVPSRTRSRSTFTKPSFALQVSHCTGPTHRSPVREWCERNSRLLLQEVEHGALTNKSQHRSLQHLTKATSTILSGTSMRRVHHGQAV